MKEKQRGIIREDSTAKKIISVTPFKKYILFSFFLREVESDRGERVAS